MCQLKLIHYESKQDTKALRQYLIHIFVPKMSCSWYQIQLRDFYTIVQHNTILIQKCCDWCRTKIKFWTHKTHKTCIEIRMLSFWWNFHHWLHWKLSKWQLPVQSVLKISSKWQHFLSMECLLWVFWEKIYHILTTLFSCDRQCRLPTRITLHVIWNSLYRLQFTIEVYSVWLLFTEAFTRFWYRSHFNFEAEVVSNRNHFRRNITMI